MQKTVSLYEGQYNSAVLSRSIQGNILVGLFSFATFYVISLSTYAYINIYVEKKRETPTLEEVWSYSKYYALRFLWANFLAVIFLIAGLVMCVLPFFYLWPILSIALSAIVLENGDISYSFSRGFKLIKENWWMSFGTLIILTIVYYACAMAIILPVTIAGSGATLFLPDFNLPFYVLVIKSVLTSLAQFLILIPIIGVSLLFFSLVEKKESEGLLERINSVGLENKQIKSKDEEY
ncbi:hypothetical protein [Pedobacter psychrophilus]|nr:hypothetical protein [Pedobacter psychrophilus]